MDAKLKRVAQLLLNNRQAAPPAFWGWLSRADSQGMPADKQEANKFLLACIIDYQILSGKAWKNAKTFAEGLLNDPIDLWKDIISKSKEEWNSKFKKYSLHRYLIAHERVWRIGTEVVRKYGGDARNIWRGQSPLVVLRRLEGMRVGPQISRMIVGALIDTHQISGSGDLKADLNVNRVLGRVVRGEVITPVLATEMARKMSSKNPWLLDRPLYRLGKDICSLRNPDCKNCYLQTECLFYKRNR